jgi:hypothetical protein
MSYLQCLFCGFLNQRGAGGCTVCHSLLPPRTHITSMQLLQNTARRRQCPRCRRTLLAIGVCTFCSAVHAATPVGAPLYPYPGEPPGESFVWQTRRSPPQVPIVSVETFSSLLPSEPATAVVVEDSSELRALSIFDLLAGDTIVDTDETVVGDMTLRFNRISNLLSSWGADQRRAVVNQAHTGALTEEGRARHVVQPTETAPDMQCPVCIEVFGDTPLSNILQLPCRHRYHSGCINTWFQRRDTCPLCRVPLNTQT